MCPYGALWSSANESAVEMNDTHDTRLCFLLTMLADESEAEPPQIF
jgi:hypothetical protein